MFKILSDPIGSSAKINKSLHLYFRISIFYDSNQYKIPKIFKLSADPLHKMWELHYLCLIEKNVIVTLIWKVVMEIALIVFSPVSVCFIAYNREINPKSVMCTHGTFQWRNRIMHNFWLNCPLHQNEDPTQGLLKEDPWGHPYPQEQPYPQSERELPRLGQGSLLKKGTQLQTWSKNTFSQLVTTSYYSWRRQVVLAERPPTIVEVSPGGYSNQFCDVEVSSCVIMCSSS